jgi:hypothetical protein
MTDSTEEYELERPVWDGGDFERMSWHDVTVWSTMANPEAFEFVLDLDYIFQWVHPGPGETYFKFWVAPVTMVLENVHSVLIDIESMQGTIEIDHLHREDPSLTPNGLMTQHRYRFECREGEISLTATSFKMFVRRKPRLLQRQSLELADRQGIGFGRTLEFTAPSPPSTARR